MDNRIVEINDQGQESNTISMFNIQLKRLIWGKKMFFVRFSLVFSANVWEMRQKEMRVPF